MKKLMIAAAIVCVAAMSQAANYTWSTARSTYVYAMNDADKLASTSIYLFAADSAADVYSAWNNGETSLASISAGRLDSTSTGTTGNIALKPDPVVSDAAVLNAIVVSETTIGGTKYLFISGASSVASVTPGAANVSFTTAQLDASKGAATKWASGGYAGAGWYAASVPEPTSGLLLLLGVAGLALRRRRA